MRIHFIITTKFLHYKHYFELIKLKYYDFYNFSKMSFSYKFIVLNFYRQIILDKGWVDPPPCRRWGSIFGKRVVFGKNIQQKTKGFLMNFEIFQFL